MLHRLRLVCVLFPGFELLDACGPLELFGMVESVLRDKEATSSRQDGAAGYELVMSSVLPLASREVRANQGPALMLDQAKVGRDERVHALLVPGGIGCRVLFNGKSPLLVLLGSRCHSTTIDDELLYYCPAAFNINVFLLLLLLLLLLLFLLVVATYPCHATIDNELLYCSQAAFDIVIIKKN